MGRFTARLFVFLLVLVAARGQEPAQVNARYTMRGSVVNSVTGEPIRKASLDLNGTQLRRTVTGPDGQFQFEGLPGGSYVINAHRAGFMDSTGWSSGTSGSSSGSVTINAAGSVTVGPDLGTVLVKLSPQARISGRVLDTDGEPVANMMVQCVQQSMVGGHKIWQAAQAATTDENGNFLLEQLRPGAVLVKTQQQQVYPGFAGDDSASRLVYRRQFYPNSPDLAGAQAIELSPGQDARADMSVSTTRGTRVSFSVTPPQRWVFPVLRDANGDDLEAGVQQNARTGEWVLPSVPPGAWALRVNSGGGPEQLSGETAIEVGNADVRGVIVALSPMLDVPITVSGGTNAGQGAPAVNVQLLPARLGLGYNVYSSGFRQVGQRTQPVVQNVTPGAYHVTAMSNGPECIASVTSGSSDLSRVDYVITGGSSPPAIEVSLRSDCASLEISAGQRRSQMFSVVVSGGPTSSEPQVLSYGSGNPSAQLKLSPGEYDVFAFSDLNEVEYANPDVLRNYRSQHVSLSPNQSATVSLDINVPGERP
jgi:Carboxypeptidase regulatory-like domain